MLQKHCNIDCYFEHCRNIDGKVKKVDKKNFAKKNSVKQAVKTMMYDPYTCNCAACRTIYYDKNIFKEHCDACYPKIDWNDVIKEPAAKYKYPREYYRK